MTILQRIILVLGAAAGVLAWLYPDSVVSVPGGEGGQVELGRRYRFAPVLPEEKGVPEFVFLVRKQLKLAPLYPAPVPARVVADEITILVTTCLLALAASSRLRGVPWSRERDTS
jgi:hypothetical protein